MDSFLCARKAIRKYSTVERVETLPLVKAFINCCLNCDIWGNEVHTHLLSCNDLVVEEEDFQKKSHQSAIDVITAAAKIIKSDTRAIPRNSIVKLCISLEDMAITLEDMGNADYEKNGYLIPYKYFLDIFFLKS